MEPTTTSSTETHFSTSYRNYVLLALTGVYVFNFIDRQILVILQESIKNDLGLSDTQLGLLTGLSFAIFYVTLGIPIARYADKANRRNIIAVALTIWSAMTAISGMAMNFLQLLLARIGVGVGEAGGSPPAHSMISDYFPENKRATALATYSVGIYIGYMLGFLFGGWLDEFFGWRMALMVLGVPGILYAIIFYFTVKEPPRGLSELKKSSSEEETTIMQVFRLLFSRKAFVYLAFGAGLNSFVIYGVGNFTPPFLERLHGLGKGEIGTWLALASGGGGAIGVFCAGYLSDQLSRINKKWYLLLPAICIAVSIPLNLMMLHASPFFLVIGGIMLTKILWSSYLGPSIAMTHGLVGLRMRALSSAVLFLVLNFIGMGLGPLFFGALSDYFSDTMGIESIRTALSLSVIVSFAAAFLYWKGAQHLEEDLAKAPA